MRRNNGPPLLRSLVPSRWADEHLLDTAHRLNRACIEWLSSISHTAGGHGDFRGVYSRLDLWAKLDVRACERASRCPVLLVDLNFRRREWWARAGQGAVCDSAVLDEPIAAPAPAMARLAREIMMEAWSITRTASLAGRLLFGMTPEVSSRIARLFPEDIDRIASRFAAELRPRWEDRPSFWENLLLASLGADDGALAKVHIHCLRLLGSEIIFPRQTG